MHTHGVPWRSVAFTQLYGVCCCMLEYATLKYRACYYVVVNAVDADASLNFSEQIYQYTTFSYCLSRDKVFIWTKLTPDRK